MDEYQSFPISPSQMDEQQSLPLLPSLQDLCLYSLVGSLADYSLQSLSLLPTALRRQLLLRLPVADIIKIENDPVFMEGLDPDSVWRGLFKSRLVPSYPSFSETIIKYKNAKEYYLSEVSLYLLTSERPGERYCIPNCHIIESHKHMIYYMLYGVKVEGHGGIRASQFSINNSMDITWIVPNRYATAMVNSNDPEEMVQCFVNMCNWYPKAIDIHENERLHEFYDAEEFRNFLSNVKTVSVTNDDYRDYEFYESLSPFWSVFESMETCPLEKIVLSACVTTLGEIVTSLLGDCDANIYSNAPAKRIYRKIIGLKHIEILGDDGGTHPHEYGYEGGVAWAMFESIPFLDSQIGLETLVVQGMENIVKSDNYQEDERYVSTYDGYEPFYNYLPYFIRKPSFRKLRLAGCEVPINSVKSMISTFLSTPTDHDQCLQLLDFITDPCAKIFSSEFPLINQEGTSPCVSGSNKTLCLKTSPLVLLSWLLEYPMLQLICLKLQFSEFRDSELKALESYPRSSIEKFSYHFQSFNCSSAKKGAFCKFLEQMPVSEIEIEGNSGENFPVLANALRQPLQLTSLKKICLKTIYSHNASVIRTLFNALFSRPKDQLAEFSLEIHRVGAFSQQDLLDSWRANSRGQKLRSLFIKLDRYYKYQDGQQTLLPLKLSELTEVAASCHID